MLLQEKLAGYLRSKSETLRGGEPLSVRAALSEIALLALESTLTSDSHRSNWLSAVHPMAFRKACVSGSARSAHGPGSVVEAIADLLNGQGADSETMMLALQALEAIAIDDPSTDVDNDHALVICAANVIPTILRLLSSPEIALHTRAAAATAALVENAHAARMFLGGGAVAPLLELSRYGGDEARQAALGALRMLSISRDAREAVANAGGKELMGSLAAHGHPRVKEAAAELGKALAAPLTASVDAKGHAQLARQTRVQQSKLWNKAQTSYSSLSRSRFTVGSRVECNMQNGQVWKAGRVVALDVSEKGKRYKYQVALDDGNGALAPEDSDRFIRAEGGPSRLVPPRAHNSAASLGIEGSRVLAGGLQVPS